MTLTWRIVSEQVQLEKWAEVVTGEPMQESCRQAAT